MWREFGESQPLYGYETLDRYRRAGLHPDLLPGLHRRAGLLPALQPVPEVDLTVGLPAEGEERPAEEDQAEPEQPSSESGDDLRDLADLEPQPDDEDGPFQWPNVAFDDAAFLPPEVDDLRALFTRATTESRAAIAASADGVVAGLVARVDDSRYRQLVLYSLPGT